MTPVEQVCPERSWVMNAETRLRDLFESAYPALSRYAIHRGLSKEDADDLVAEALEIAWRHLDKVPADDPLPWLYAVAHNLWRNKLRSDRRRVSLLTRLSAVAHPQASESSTLDGEALRNALRELKEDDQELLRLVAWDGLSPAQAAAVLGCSPGAARVRLHRARNRLASRLGYHRLKRSDLNGQIRVSDEHHALEVSDD